MKTNFPSRHIGSSWDIHNPDHNLRKVSYNRAAITGLIRAAKNYGVRLLESDFINNHSKGGYEGVVIVRCRFAELLDAILNRNESAAAIQERVECIRGLKQ